MTFRPITDAETKLYDPAIDWKEGSPDGGVRLNLARTPFLSGDARWQLQVCGWVKTKTSALDKPYAIAVASMSQEDLRWLRDQINEELRRNP